VWQFRVKSNFLQALHSGQVLLMDGAMGTELQRRGLRPGENATTWNLLHPDRVRAVHAAHRAAGAQVLLSNTFSIHDVSLLPALKAAGSDADIDAVWRASFEVMGAGAYRMAAIGPIAGKMSSIELEEIERLRLPAAVQRFDAVMLETCSSPRVRFALRRLRESTKLPILLSISFQRTEEGKLLSFSGHPPEWFAERAESYGVAALGVNCGRDIGMDEIIEIVRRYRSQTDLALFARPNAGTPTRRGQRWIYPQSPAALAKRLPELVDAGVAMVGGCCGTTPKHIAAFRAVVAQMSRR
jgi:methionine synthase I (cobalamin-dependent)